MPPIRLARGSEQSQALRSPVEQADSMRPNLPVVRIQETRTGGATHWLDFRKPARVLSIRRLADILPALEEIDTAVHRGYWAAGFLAYEAAPAFDRAFRTARPTSSLPLLWFGIYSADHVGAAAQEPLATHSPIRRTFPAPARWRPSVSEAQFCHAIAAIRRAIARGETYQVNYSFRLRAPAPQQTRPLARLLPSAGYGAWLDLGAHLICSASPELFFRRDGERMVCRPMKGTAPRGRTPAEDALCAKALQYSAKNRAENLMIVDMVRNDLGRIARTGSVRVDRLFEIERYDTLWQMTSTVSARTQASWPDVFRALFPCASITGAPKVQTMLRIAELEPAPRGIYTGAIGFIGPDRRAQFNVAIRTLHVDRERQRLEYGTGAGITWDSDAREEWTECRTKALILKPSEPFELLETIRWEPGRGFVLLSQHLQRLAASAGYFGYAYSRSTCQRALRAAAAPFARAPQRVRLLLNRQGRARIESARLDQAAAPFARIPRLVRRVALADQPVDSRDRFLYHKTTRREVYDRALRRHPDCHDVMLWNERGELTESCLANLVIVRGQRWLTPPVSCGLLPGTYRAQLLAQGKLQEAVLTRDDLRLADRVLLINSVRGVMEAELPGV